MWKVYCTNLPMSNGFTFEMFQFFVTKFFYAAQMGAFASVDKAMLIT